VHPSSLIFFLCPEGIANDQALHKEHSIKHKTNEKNSFLSTKIDFHTFILLYAKLSANSSFDSTESPSSNVGNPKLLPISQQTDISLMSGRQYKKSSSPLSLNTNAPLDTLASGHSVELLVLLL
jgi:hypothetical protein